MRLGNLLFRVYSTFPHCHLQLKFVTFTTVKSLMLPRGGRILFSLLKVHGTSSIGVWGLAKARKTEMRTTQYTPNTATGTSKAYIGGGGGGGIFVIFQFSYVGLYNFTVFW